jgi:hypothetical protein
MIAIVDEIISAAGKGMSRAIAARTSVTRSYNVFAR